MEQPIDPASAQQGGDADTPPTAPARARRLKALPLRAGDDPVPATITLYSFEQAARPVTLDELGAISLSERDLLWVDLVAPEQAELDGIATALDLEPPAVEFLADQDATPTYRDFGSSFGVRVAAVGYETKAGFHNRVLRILGLDNVVVSISDGPLELVEQLRERQQQNSNIGVLGAESFAVSMLDGHLATYHDAMSRLELEIERLEIRILSEQAGDCLDQLCVLRKASSWLRRGLAAHRSVFDGLARPDFRPNQTQRVDEHFSALAARYGRAMDMVEHGRDLVVGTFDVFTTRAAMSTNHSMQVLTFVTVLIGALAVLAGILGMNFHAPFFDSGAKGFWIAVASLGTIAVAAMLLAKWRRWL